MWKQLLSLIGRGVANEVVNRIDTEVITPRRRTRPEMIPHYRAIYDNPDATNVQVERAAAWLEKYDPEWESYGVPISRPDEGIQK